VSVGAHLTTRCSGLATLAAELDIVRRRMSYQAHLTAVFLQSTAVVSLCVGAITLFGLWLWSVLKHPALRASGLILVCLSLALSPWAVTELINSRIVEYSAIAGRVRFEPSVLAVVTPPLVSIVVGTAFLRRRRRQQEAQNEVVA
jgi:hypothetical protein